MNKIELKIDRSGKTDKNRDTLTVNGVVFRGLTDITYNSSDPEYVDSVTLTMLGDVTVTYHDEEK